MVSIFISHSSEDKNFARKLVSILENNKIEVWIDETKIGVGDSLFDKISDGLMQTDYFILILTPNSVSSEWVKRELKAILMDEIDEKKVRVLPILYKDCDIPPFLRDRLYIDFRNSDIDESKFKIQASNLIQYLNEQKLGKKEQEIKKIGQVEFLKETQETITVEILSMSQGSRYEIRVPLDIMVHRIINQILDNLKIPKLLDDGTPLLYRLCSINCTGNIVYFDPALTVRENGIQENETLMFEAIVMGG